MSGEYKSIVVGTSQLNYTVLAASPIGLLPTNLLRLFRAVRQLVSDMGMVTTNRTFENQEAFTEQEINPNIIKDVFEVESLFANLLSFFPDDSENLIISGYRKSLSSADPILCGQLFIKWGSYWNGLVYIFNVLHTIVHDYTTLDDISIISMIRTAIVRAISSIEKLDSLIQVFDALNNLDVETTKTGSVIMNGLSLATSGYNVSSSDPMKLLSLGMPLTSLNRAITRRLLVLDAFFPGVTTAGADLSYSSPNGMNYIQVATNSSHYYNQSFSAYVMVGLLTTSVADRIITLANALPNA